MKTIVKRKHEFVYFYSERSYVRLCYHVVLTPFIRFHCFCGNCMGTLSSLLLTFPMASKLNYMPGGRVACFVQTIGQYSKLSSDAVKCQIKACQTFKLT